ncbi:MAG: ABC transporter substrate-binding protein [Thermodesulfovibrionales bacterium]|nr:ABC transporter substrate-binding protein [Thermodesulfovibrionales bacterium]
MNSLIGDAFRTLIPAVLLVIALSCSSSSRLEGHIYYRLNVNPSTLDPALITDVSGASIAAKLFNGLVKLNGDLEVIPDIAERWEVAKDGLKYRFFIRRGVTFHNGRKVNAMDFKFSFERVLNPKTRSPNTWVFDRVQGAKKFIEGKDREVSGFKIINDYAFEIILDRPFSPFLNMLTMTAAYVVPKEEVEREGYDFPSEPVGSGPFILKSWLPNRELLLKVNDRYFDRKPLIRGIVYRIIPEDLTAITEFELGNIDVIYLPASAYSTFKNDKSWSRNLISFKGLNTYYLGMNTSRPPFDNINLRRAISLAIDREKILRTLYEGRGRLAAGPVPDLLRKWEIKETLGYNPKEAKEIIKREGASGLKINMHVTADQEVVDLAEVVQSFLSEAGMNVNIKQLEWSAYKESINKGEPDMFWLSWWADYPDAENFLFPLFHSSNFGAAGNRTRYSNREVDLLIERGQHSINERERNSYYKRAEELIIRDTPWVFFWHRTDYLVRQPWIKDYTMYPIYTIDKGTEVGIKKGADH